VPREIGYDEGETGRPHADDVVETVPEDGEGRA
jgi:hypothetical protein